MEHSIEKEITRELILITKAILSHLNVLQLKDLKTNFEDSIKKLSKLTLESQNYNLNNFIYFIQNLFLDENGNFDFDPTYVYEEINRDDLVNIFKCLLKNLEALNFLNFLLDVGEIFSDIYFNYEDMTKITEKYSHKNLHIYEIIFKILALGKKSKEAKLIYANYDLFFSYDYLNRITTNMMFAININYRLTTSNEFKEILDDEFNKIFFDRIDNIEEQLAQIVNYIKKCINIFWVNSIFYQNNDINDFLSIIYNFITDNGSKEFKCVFQKKTNEENFFRAYFEYFSFKLIEIIESLSEESINTFKIDLYNFVIQYLDKNGTNNYINSLLTCQINNNLSREQFGLITMIFLNKHFINEMIVEIKEYNNNINKLAEDLGLNNDEIMVIKQISNELYPEKKEPNENTKKNSSHIIIKKEIKNDNTIKSVNSFENKIERKKDNIEYIQDNKSIIKEYNTINIITNKNWNELNIINKVVNFQINAPLNESNKNIINSEDINQRLERLEKLQKQFFDLKNEYNEYKRNNEDYKIKNEEYKRKNEEYKRKNEEYKRQNDKYKHEVDLLKENIKSLENIHKGIYFRDVSKFFIKKFADKYEDTKGDNLFNTCNNILKFNFKMNNIENMKSIICSIVNHYLLGNKNAHIRYFISNKIKSNNNKNLLEIIRTKYNEYMKFSLKDQIKLKDYFNFNEAFYLLNKR